MLDIGVGNGRMGFLAREYAAQSWNARYTPGDRVVDGIEGYGPYIGDLQRVLYDELVIAEALETLDAFSKARRRYNLALAADVIEHFDLDEGHRLVELGSSIADLLVVVTPRWQFAQTSAENPFEDHRSFWPPDLLKSAGSVRVDEYETSTIAYFGNAELIVEFRRASRGLDYADASVAR